MKTKITGLIILLLLSGAACRPPFALKKSPGEEVLRIATWNIENFSLVSSGLGEEENAVKLSEITDILCRSLHCPDIIALQEVMDDSGTVDDGTTGGKANFTALALALEQAARLPYRYCSVNPVDGKDGGKPGANIRTGFLYNSARVTPVSAPESWNAPEFAYCRKPLSAEFHFAHYRISLINIHLTSRIGGEKSDYYRKKQAAFLAERITGLRKEDRNGLILLTGDFNDTPDSETLRTLTEGAYPLKNLTIGPSYEYRGDSMQLDHMLASPILSERVLRTGILTGNGKARLPSDHRPLLAEFHLPAEPDGR